MIAIVDYGMGNLRSVWKAFRHLGADARLTDRPEDVRDADAVVLPGVGAFGDCMANLKRLGLARAIERAIEEGKPYLGICLGLQILFEQSSEFGRTPGLGILKGAVKRFPRSGLKVPHMGWNSIEIQLETPLLEGIPQGSHFYFVHSYYVEPAEPDCIASETEYGLWFASSIWRENLFACQFHPEKSQALGLKIIENFLRQIRPA